MHRVLFFRETVDSQRPVNGLVVGTNEISLNNGIFSLFDILSLKSQLFNNPETGKRVVNVS